MASPAASEQADSDVEGEETQPQKRQEQLHDQVDHFLGSLLEGLKTRSVEKVEKLYEETFNKITEKHFPKTRWPSVEVVKREVAGDKEELFLIFYRELYYRHVYSRCAITYDDRKGSWENYCMLLDLIIEDLQDTSKEELSLALPGQWIWDMLDEFVYHYQTYCNFRNKAVKTQKKDDIKSMKENPEVWSTNRVLAYLHDIVQNSKIQEYLMDLENSKGRTGGAFTDEPVRLLGYFSLMQLLRMHSLLGDYHLALKIIECIDFRAEVPLFYRISACHVTLFYYMGFAYVMLRRYVDAIRTFSDILVFLSKTSGVNSLSYQYDQIIKKQDQMFVLLLISLALCPRPIDESLEKTIREKYNEKQGRLHRGEHLCFEELFSYSCPKFVTGVAPNFDHPESFVQNEAHNRQLHLFLQEVKQQQSLPRIGSYMKLYTAIKISKLAQLCEMDEDGLRDQLMCVMHKSQQKVHHDGPPLDGVVEPCSEVEFYLDGEMVHINAQKAERAHADVFLEQILKYQELLKKMGKN
mmetsp:Transcript_66828/g.159947  ORF Transcript_66828/g.159947 Transcript_66828/m.159947 type:complete len:523 (+) Transcript_66828:169-1737(+)